MEQSFFFAIPNLDSRDALKAEMHWRYPDFRLAYMRPGFVTFKGPLESSLESLIFARRYGKVVGRFTLSNWESALLSTPHDVVHRYTRDGLEVMGPASHVGQRVLNVIRTGADEVFLGIHLHQNHHGEWACPGGNPHVVLPDESPSRAYLKIEEAQLWAQFFFRDRSSVLEIGSAPGGAAYALLQRGCRVTGVDTGQMDSRCLSHPNYRHRAMPMQILREDDIPRALDGLLCDVNLGPDDVLPHLARIVRERPMIKAMFYTLKMGQFVSVHNIPSYLQCIRDMGFKHVMATQLPSNRSEICVVALKQSE